MSASGTFPAAAGTSSSKAGAPAPAASGQSVNKRLQSELMSLMMGGDAGISAFPDGDNIFQWTGTITGGAGTVYEGLTFKLSLKFPTGYPYEAPAVTFNPPSCFHPNVDQYGNICLDILKEKWSAVYNVRTILLSIQSLLGDPNLDSPLNGHAASLWPNQADFKKAAAQAQEQLALRRAEAVGPARSRGGGRCGAQANRCRGALREPTRGAEGQSARREVGCKSGDSQGQGGM
eukprot:CAMPEP_0185286934 /NCGR_PEP_ID=MMETSP1363-20130426/2537_1 /TAXON_ID=38817 /ORGANISM="Gephyrocapsa oceanica, Strain RCC1303" /LENGTH=232 /DNA_ID=CAMNT_0027882753 /DNA_START=77 /DNA_END=774 /DNA_ORIENTATION=-